MVDLIFVLKTLKKRVGIYFVYFIGMISILSLLIMYTNFISSVIKSFNDVSERKLVDMKLTSIGVTVLVLLFFFFIIIYGNKMMQKSKAKEYGLFKLYGRSNKRLFKLIFLEQMMVLLLSFIISIVIGTLLSLLLIFLSNLSIEQYIMEGFKLSISVKNYLLIFIFLIILGLLSSFINYRSVNKKEVIDLINDEINIKPAKEISLVKFSFYLVAVVLIYIFLMLIAQNQIALLNMDELFLIAICWCVGVYLSYKVFAYSLIKLVPRKILYKGDNLFTTAQITRKLSSSLKAMTFITILLVFLFSFIFIGSYIQNYSKLTYPKDDVVYDNNNTTVSFKYLNKEYDFTYNDIFKNIMVEDGDVYSENYVGYGNYSLILESEVNKFLKTNNLKQIELKKDETFVINPYDESYEEYIATPFMEEVHLKVKKNLYIEEINKHPNSTATTYIIFPDENLVENSGMEYVKAKQKILDEYEGSYKSYTIKGNTKMNMLSLGEESNANLFATTESIVNEYFEFEGIDENIDLGYGEFELIGSMISNGEDLEDYNDVYFYNEAVDESGNYVFNVNKVGKIVERKEMYLSVNDYFKNVIVASDEQVKELIEQEKAMLGKDFINYDVTLLKFTDQKNEQNQKWVSLDKKEYYTPEMLTVKTEYIKSNYFDELVVLSFTIYMSFILLVLLICVLALHSSIDSVENKKEFEKVKKLNYTKKDLRKSVNKITVAYFLIPFVVAMINIYLYFTPFLLFLKSTNYFPLLNYMNFNSCLVILIVLLIIYISFFILINYCYKKIVGV